MTGTGETRPHMRMAAALRRDIAYGHLPPGARIPQSEYAGRYHTPRDTDAEAAATTDQIAARLTAGQWAPGTVLPPQQTLAKHHATQTPVISAALRKLAAQGRLTPVPLGGRRYAYLVPSPAHPAPAPQTKDDTG